MIETKPTAPLEKRAALLAAQVRNRHCDERGDVNAYELARATEELLAKLDMPCGHCHPCTNWAPQTWINAGRSIPPVHEYDAMVAELELRRAGAK